MGDAASPSRASQLVDILEGFRTEKNGKQALIVALVFVSYLATAAVGLNLHSVNTFATLIWPPSGIALAVMLLCGYRIWPVVWVAAFIVNVSIGGSPLVAFGIACGNTIGPLFGAALVRWYSGYHPAVLRLRDNVGILASALLVPVITATIGVGTLALFGLLTADAFPATWNTWWLGDALGIFVCAPFILKYGSKPFFTRTRWQYIEFALVILSVVAFSVFIFWTSETPYRYTLFIPLTWAALRTGPRGTTLAILLAAGIAIVGTVQGHGPFAAEGLFHLQVYIGTVSGVFLMFTAVVEERKRGLQMLEQYVDELEIALHKISSEDEARKEFIAVLAHELRNPLATILSTIELLTLQGAGTPQTTPALEAIEDRARAMVRMLDDLLDISRISHRKLKLKKEVIAVDPFIDKLVRTVQPLMRRHGHALSVTKPDRELFLNADPVRLEQIFINLLTNAAKYTKPPGTIDLTVLRENGMLRARLRDSGVGIPKNMLRRIFEPFFQVNRDPSTNEGLGIGLPLTRQLVEMHGGTIEAKSAGVDSGSEFIVSLPLHESAPAVVTAPQPERVRAPRHAKHTFSILIIDDNEAATLALSRLLELRGHTSATAFLGVEGIEKALRGSPDVILLDIGLPDIDGYEVAEKLRKHKKPYFIIALTGYGQIEDKERAKQAGFDYHLTKPAGLKEIEAALRKMPRKALAAA